MQVQNLDWQEECLAQWDQECQISNGDYFKRNSSLCDTRSSTSSLQTLNEIIHSVTPWDSLEGISILYNVSIGSIKQRNQLSSNDVYYLQNIVIPQPTIIVGKTLQEEKQEKMAQFLIQACLDHKDENIAFKALEESFWKLQNALLKYKKDQKWQAKYSDLFKGNHYRKRKSEGFHKMDRKTI